MNVNNKKSLKKDFSVKKFDYMPEGSHPLLQRISTLELSNTGDHKSPESSRQQSRKVGDYIFQGKIGEGAFGVIHRCRSLIDNGTYVIKEIKIGRDGSGKNETLMEAQLLQKIQHK